MKGSVKFFTACISIILIPLFVMYSVSVFFTPSKLKTDKLTNTFLNGSFPLSLSYSNTNALAVHADNTSSKNVSAKLMMFNIFPVKEVNISLEERKYVIPGGIPFGIRLYTNGLVVTETTSVSSGISESYPAQDAGIKSGDVIRSVNDKTLTSNEQLLRAVEESDGQPIKIDAIHENSPYSTTITPVFDNSIGKYRAGLYVRDSCAGIGTMTYIDPSNGSYAGLGHGICDSESGRLMPLLSGDIVRADITSVRKSICGSPGSLNGHFNGTTAIGSLLLNSEHGVYGKYYLPDKNAKTIPVAFKQETVNGGASLLTSVENNIPLYYDIEIEEISYNDLNTSKNMIVKVTDERLLKKAGGIVQGMSGSPIIQNGRLVGAVTHVFVNDPTRGYAVFAENMLEYSENIPQTIYNRAA